jgi:predicted RNA-binding protein with PUA-like domain
MAYWLVKSEPFKYSWEQFVKDKQTFWDGVRNYGARNNLRAMKKGEQVLFYHSNEGVEIVGIAKVIKEYYQDPTTEEDAWVVVDLGGGGLSRSRSEGPGEELGAVGVGGCVQGWVCV